MLLGGAISHRAIAGFTVGQEIIRSVSARPLRMLVLGDSILWGQGLKDEHKFSYLIREWLCLKRQHDHVMLQQNCEASVQLHVEAHSGATIFKYQERDGASKNKSPGEVPHSNPTVVAQIKQAADFYREQSIASDTVDLILVNGGINDLHAARLFLPFIFAPSITAEADKYCHQKMALVLEQLVATFPNARIVVPGYLPLISEKTSSIALLELLEITFANQSRNVEGFLKDDSAGELIRKLGVSERLRLSILDQFTKLSNAWAKASTAAFRQAADEINFKHPWPSSPSMVSSSRIATGALNKRVMVIEVPFKSENAYGASDTYFWKAKRLDEKLDCIDPTLGLQLTSEDEMYRERPCMCQREGKANELNCLHAGFMHPNRAGAQAYRDAIVKELEAILPLTSWL